jgi:lipid-A-disaccharide synthase
MKIGLVAGESSGDLLGAGLVRELRRRYPEAIFEGIAGPEMLAAGCEQWEASEALAVFGLIEPLVHVPRLLRLRKELLNRWRQSPPDVFVGIDSPDFNLGLEKRLRAAGIKTIHYVSPSIWAWRSGRMKTIKAAADRVLCLLPFEKKLYDDAGVDADFVGHPKADEAPVVADMATARQTLGLRAEQIVAVLPGSRKGEISLLGETLVAAAVKIAAGRKSIQFVTPVATPALREAIEAIIRAAGMQEQFVLLEGDSQRAMMSADVVLLASGTAALESALLQKPTVAAYRIGNLSYTIVKAFNLVNLKYFTLPNLLTEEELIPEFIQEDINVDDIAAAVNRLLDNPAQRQMISDRFAKLRSELALNTDQRAADAVIELAKK